MKRLWNSTILACSTVVVHPNVCRGETSSIALGWGSSGRRFKSCRPDGERSRSFNRFGIVPILVLQFNPFLSKQRFIFTMITYFSIFSGDDNISNNSI